MNRNRDDIDDLFDDDDYMDEVDDLDDGRDDNVAGSLSDMVSDLEAKLAGNARRAADNGRSAGRRSDYEDEEYDEDYDDEDYDDEDYDDEEEYDEDYDDDDYEEEPVKRPAARASVKEAAPAQPAPRRRIKALEEARNELGGEDENAYIEKRTASRKKRSGSSRGGFNKKFLIYGVIGLAALALIGVLIWIIRNGGGSSSSDTNETPIAMESQTQEQVEQLELNAYPEINQLIQSYYAALQASDVAALEGLLDTTAGFSVEKLAKTNEYTESYNNFNIYTHSGMTPDSKIVYVDHYVKFRNIAEPAANLSYYYVQQQEGGSYKIISQPDETTQSYIDTVSAQQPVQDLMASVNARFADAIAKDADLKALVERLNGSGADQSTEAPAPEVGGTDADGYTITNETVRATADVRVRSGASTDSEILGVLEEGTTITRTGYTADWSKVDYNGQTAFVSSEYLTTE